jgi:hypothetical protein
MLYKLFHIQIEIVKFVEFNDMTENRRSEPTVVLANFQFQ